jgi:hypothetical protein
LRAAHGHHTSCGHTRYITQVQTAFAKGTSVG